MKHLKKVVAVGSIVAGVLTLSACYSDADTASDNIAKAAEQFEVQRTIVGQSGIDGQVFLFAEGRCSFEHAADRRVDLTCKYGPNDYRKQTVIIGDQDRVVVAQEEPIDVSVYHTRIILKPQSILPEFDIEVGEQ